MALSRSASGPGGLSINTSSANSLFGSNSGTTGGMFGSTQASKPLFGASTTTTAPQTGGLFGSTQPATGGLFGSTANATASQTPATGGLFGASTQPASTGGLFGASTQPPATGGLFGASAQPPATGGLFGASSQPQPGGGLFGSTTSSQPQTGGLFGTAQPQPTGGLFSGLGQQTQSTGGLFGATSAANTQPAQSGGLFGSNTQAQNKPTNSLFGGLGSTQNQQTQPQQTTMFGASQNQGGLLGNTGLSLGQSSNQQQTVPGVRIDTANVRSTTRFNDLHEDLQKQIENFDAAIQAQIQLRNDCDAIMPSHDSQLAQVPIDVDFCSRKLLGVQNAESSDAQSIAILKKHADTDVQNASLSVNAIHNLRLPYQYHTTGIWNQKASSNDNRVQQRSETEDIVGFFSKTAEELANTLSTYQRHIAEIEQHLRGVEANSAQQINALVARRNGSSSGEEDPRMQLGGVFRDMESSLLGVAAKVGSCRDGIQSLQLGQFKATQSKQPNGNRGGVY